jgi:uncharacterized membrane protein
MEAFSDGVLSIAATLLVFNLALRPPGTPQEQFRHAWPAYLGYAISFLTIGAAWLGHTSITARLTHVDPVLLRINLLLLLLVAFLPFPTRLVADALRDTNAERIFVTVYGLTLLSIRLLVFALDAYARSAQLYSHEQGDDPAQEERKNRWPVVIGYMAAIVIGLASPVVAVGLYFALTLFLVVPARNVRRAVAGHHT